MSLVALRIELPAYSHTFSIQLLSSCTISQVKNEIEAQCPGSPRPNGQRLICRGRVLADDTKVEDIWQSSDEPHVIHLAVHPSAWTSEPPTVPQSVAQAVPARTTPIHTAPTLTRPASLSTDVSPTLLYILTKHNNAQLSLLGLDYLPASDIEPSVSKQLAKQVVERNGFNWPPILDEDFPERTPGGLIYERITSDDQRYLVLKNPTTTPTPLQVHCLKLLTFTFPLLSLSAHNIGPLPISSQPLLTTQIPPHVNQVLAQLGLPQIPVVQNVNGVQNGNAIQLPAPNRANNVNVEQAAERAIRPLFLLAPTLMLLFRTALLLYFFAPARKPLFGILLLALVLYEAWQPIRNAFMRGAAPQQPRPINEPANVPLNQPANIPANQAGNQAENEAPNQPANHQENQDPEQRINQQPQRPNLVQQPPETFVTLLELFATINLDLEEKLIALVPAGTPPAPEPGWVHKFTAFVSLLTVTVHPAIWDRRRSLLAVREGRIRTEAEIRNTDPGEEVSEARANARAQLLTQHENKPAWVRRYIDRVLANEWQDGLD